jgi:hypothetical protein
MNLTVPYIGSFIIPTDQLIFFRGVGLPPTRYSSMGDDSYPQMMGNWDGPSENHVEVMMWHHPHR